MASGGRVLRCALGLAATALTGSLVAGEASCGVDGACGADEVGLLQTHLGTEVEETVEDAVASVPEKHYVIDLRGDKGAGADSCSPGISIKVSNTHIPDDTSLSYNFPELPSNGRSYCRDSDEHGPRDCCETWGGDALMHYSLKSGEVPTPKWTAHVSAKIQAKIMWSWVDIGSIETSCGVCGCTCVTPKVVLAGLYTVESETIEMPPCPEKAEFMGSIKLMLPTDLSVPMEARGTADVQLKNANGEVVAKTTAEVKLAPP